MEVEEDKKRGTRLACVQRDWGEEELVIRHHTRGTGRDALEHGG